jgi:alpha-L-rhamnosidase
MTSQTYLSVGNNAAGIYLGDGWYRGNFGFGHNWNSYGTQTALLFQLEIEYQNGRKETIISDGSWKAATGPIRMSSFYHGETYDARMEIPGWSTYQFEKNNWQEVKVTDYPTDQLICPETEPVRKIQELRPDSIFQTPKGETVVDFGQNMVGWVKIRVKGNRGDTVLLRHAEVLDQEGNFYLDNIRSARQEILYILKGGGEEVFEPHFTFQGFRYVRVDQFPGGMKADNLTAVVIHTDLVKTGSFECSNPLVNQLQHNILWGQKGNYLEIPTDCPQRDERMGWTGDVQVFAPTGCFNYDSYTFLSKWLKDLKADQLDNGSVPYVIPDIHYKNGSTGWGDASTIVPWALYMKYGDREILERQYDSMKDWVGYLENLAGKNYLVQDGHHFGDWMYFVHPLNNEPKPGHTDVDLIATAYYARSAYLTAKTAGVLHQLEDQNKYEALFEKIKTAFQYEFVTPSGRLSPNSQTAYVLALAFELLEEKKIPKAVEYLVDNIKKRDYHLSTGFLGTPLLCQVLTEHGHTDIAYRLLLQESFPSWLYQVKRGATTMWERWDGIEPDGSFQEVYANSFNHFAKGAVGDWMYSVVGGIQHDEEKPGYKHIIIKPEPSADLEYAKVELESPYGLIRSHWTLQDGDITLEVRIPPNTTATVFLPGHPEKKEGMQLGSGGYRFNYQWSEE